MKRVIFGIVISFVVVGSSYGLDLDGTYVGKKEFPQSINKVIIKGNTFNFENYINEILDPDEGICNGCCNVLRNGVIKIQGKKILVYEKNRLMYEIKKNGNNLRLIPEKDWILKRCKGKEVVEEDPDDGHTVLHGDEGRTQYMYLEMDDIRKSVYKKVK